MDQATREALEAKAKEIGGVKPMADKAGIAWWDLRRVMRGERKIDLDMAKQLSTVYPDLASFFVAEFASLSDCTG